MKKNLPARTGIFLFFALFLGTLGILTFHTRTVSATDHYYLESSWENNSCYTEKEFENDFKALRCRAWKNNFSRNKKFHPFMRPAGCLAENYSFYLKFLPISNKNSAIYSGFNLNSGFIACTAPPRASPCL